MREYVIPFDTAHIPKKYADVVIIGSGIAGLYTALRLPSHMDILLVSKGSYKETNSYLAQGGIATSFGEGTHEQFYKDTMICGKGESDTRAVWAMIHGASENIGALEALGVPFDKDEKGQFLFGKEGAHRVSRIIRSGDHTGKSIMDVLYHRVKEKDNIHILDNVFAIDLLTQNQQCMGVLIMNKGKVSAIYARATVLNTGGIGNLYAHTTNAKGIQGDGIAMVLRAKGQVKNMSYTQFHPTVYYNPHHRQKQSFLISEAVRGEGALLYNEKGERFMENVHPMKELAPRDIVSKAIMEQLRKQKKPYVDLDITHLQEEQLKERFPTIFSFLKGYGINMATDYIPVAPNMHYFMGGIKVNIDGQTSIHHLYACGECACTGVHGKNRLASNSLLEAIVFGNRIAKGIHTWWDKEPIAFKDIRCTAFHSNHAIMESQETISYWMEHYFSLNRSMEHVEHLQKQINGLNRSNKNKLTVEDIEKMNAVLVIQAMIKDDMQKRESLEGMTYGTTAKS
ncbi:L-aspartate oxidase [Vallitalea pronyensis]|uniref:L-aspartate oxidase n=1 Tax=Vallitalea pronyensis TaxID=1348613 RepID=A0A8J8MGJ5_9FIRM|nr:L-aspartate oxidase [Vallitalea pronyensis]QUI21097.1 L-aspartate oxidase [Vallitalea pronyensis]